MTTTTLKAGHTYLAAQATEYDSQTIREITVKLVTKDFYQLEVLWDFRTSTTEYDEKMNREIEVKERVERSLIWVNRNQVIFNAPELQVNQSLRGVKFGSNAPVRINYDYPTIWTIFEDLTEATMTGMINENPDPNLTPDAKAVPVNDNSTYNPFEEVNETYTKDHIQQG